MIKEIQKTTFTGTIEKLPGSGGRPNLHGKGKVFDKGHQDRRGPAWDVTGQVSRMSLGFVNI